MLIIPASALSSHDLSLLGNNLQPARRQDPREVEAINRSLSTCGEELDEFDSLTPEQPFNGFGPRRSRRVRPN